MNRSHDSEADGVVLLGETVVGEYRMRKFPDDEILISLHEGAIVEKFVQYAIDKGQKWTLMPKESR